MAFFQDNPIGTGDGTFQNRRLFQCQPGHASLVPVSGLLRAEDFREQQQPFRSRKNSAVATAAVAAATAAIAAAVNPLPMRSYSSMVKNETGGQQKSARGDSGEVGDLLSFNDGDLDKAYSSQHADDPLPRQSGLQHNIGKQIIY